MSTAPETVPVVGEVASQGPPTVQVKPEVREVVNPSAIGRGDSAVVVGQTKTTASTGDSQYKTEFVKVYQDAGVIGVAMLTLLVLCLLLAWFSTRVLRMYTTMLDSRDKAEALRLEYFDKLTTAVTNLSADVASVKLTLSQDHEAHSKEIEAARSDVRSLHERVTQFLLQRGGSH